VSGKKGVRNLFRSKKVPDTFFSFSSGPHSRRPPGIVLQQTTEPLLANVTTEVERCQLQWRMTSQRHMPKD
jgi:hypothetical protein